MGNKLSIEQRIQNAKEIYGNKFDYSSWNVKTSKEVGQVRCTEHGVTWNVSYDNHVNQKKECPKCKGAKISERKIKNVDYAQKKLDKKFKGKVTIVEDTYTAMTHPCKMVCSEHGVFEDNITGLLCQKYPCKLCAEDKGHYTRTFTTEEFVKLHTAHLPHCIFDESLYISMTEPFTFYCSKHKKYCTILQAHNVKRCVGCDQCAREGRSKKQQGFLNDTTIERNADKYKRKKNHLYLIRIPTLGEDIYKIGIAAIPCNRYYKVRQDFGSCEELIRFKTNTYTAYHVEQFLFKLFSNQNYKDFEHNNDNGSRKKGVREIFKLDQEHVNFIKEFLLDVKEDWYID